MLGNLEISRPDWRRDAPSAAAAKSLTLGDPVPSIGAAGHWLNEERLRVYSWMIVVIFTALFAVWLGRSLPNLVDPSGKPFGYDFMAFWSAARLALAGRPEAAFDQHAISAVQHAAVPFMPGLLFAWHYPPTFLLPVAPLGLLPYPAALALFVLATAALWGVLLRRVLTDPRAWIVAAAAPAGLINLLDGQNGFLTASLAGFALLSLRRRPIVAGVLIGLLAIKPQLAVLFPLALVAEGSWRSIAAAAATASAFALASLAAFGAADWAAFFRDLPIAQAMTDAGALPWGAMPTANVFALSLGAPLVVARALQAAVALFAAYCVWRAWRNRAAPFAAKAATLLAASLLVSPYLFDYDLVWAALAVGWLATLGLRDGFRRGEREILLFAYLAPAVMPPVQMLTSLQLGFPAILLLLIVAVRRAAPLTAGERDRLRRAVAAPGPATLPWLAVSALVLFDLTMCCRLGWTVANWSAAIVPAAILATIGLGYHLSGRSAQLASLANWLLLWVVFTLGGAALAYLAAATARPLQDGIFAAADLALGFDWRAWYGFVADHPALRLVLGLAYTSMMPQVVLAVFYCCWRDDAQRNREFLLTSLVGLLITIAVFWRLPALGPGVGMPQMDALYIDALIALRNGANAIDVTQLHGIAAFPSFHAVMAVLLIYVYRDTRLFWPAAIVNGLMLMSTPSDGGHYLVDALAGCLIAGCAILAVSGLRPRDRRAGVMPRLSGPLANAGAAAAAIAIGGESPGQDA
jgi:hypothetical protein